MTDEQEDLDEAVVVFGVAGIDRSYVVVDDGEVGEEPYVVVALEADDDESVVSAHDSFESAFATVRTLAAGLELEPAVTFTDGIPDGVALAVLTADEGELHLFRTADDQFDLYILWDEGDAELLAEYGTLDDALQGILEETDVADEGDADASDED